jgi:Nucleotidyl transferase AbiEii toxin, Type IV TA system
LSGSVRWPVTAWRRLLELALGVLDGAGVPIQWTFGGGTALALKVGHRVSYDVDLFLEDASALRLLSPNRNAAARSITDRWQEPGNYIKLELEEGSVDFILAGRQTALMPWLYPFMDRKVHVEQPAEIIAKKLKYRGSRLLSRDLFDLLAVHRWDPIQLSAAVRAVPEAARRAADRIKRFAPRYRDTIREEVNPTAAGVDLLDVDPLEAVKILTGA